MYLCRSNYDTCMNRKGVVHNHLNNCHAWLTMIVCTFRMALHIGCTTTYYVDKGYSKVGSVFILNLIHISNNLTNNWRNNWWSIIDALEQSSKNSCRIGDLKDLNDSKLIVNESKWFPWSSRIKWRNFGLKKSKIYYWKFSC